MIIIHIIVTVLLSITTGIIWFKIKFILVDHNHPVTFLYLKISDITKFVSIIKKEAEERTKQQYKIVLLAFIISVILFLSSFFSFLIVFGDKL
jgi:hypothetical protein